jgi:hypothetical protein
MSGEPPAWCEYTAPCARAPPKLRHNGHASVSKHCDWASFPVPPRAFVCAASGPTPTRKHHATASCVIQHDQDSATNAAKSDISPQQAHGTCATSMSGGDEFADCVKTESSKDHPQMSADAHLAQQHWRLSHSQGRQKLGDNACRRSKRCSRGQAEARNSTVSPHLDALSERKEATVPSDDLKPACHAPSRWSKANLRKGAPMATSPLCADVKEPAHHARALERDAIVWNGTAPVYVDVTGPSSSLYLSSPASNASGADARHASPDSTSGSSLPDGDTSMASHEDPCNSGQGTAGACTIQEKPIRGANVPACVKGVVSSQLRDVAHVSSERLVRQWEAAASCDALEQREGPPLEDSVSIRNNIYAAAAAAAAGAGAGAVATADAAWHPPVELVSDATQGAIPKAVCAVALHAQSDIAVRSHFVATTDTREHSLVGILSAAIPGIAGDALFPAVAARGLDASHNSEPSVKKIKCPKWVTALVERECTARHGWEGNNNCEGGEAVCSRVQLVVAEVLGKAAEEADAVCESVAEVRQALCTVPEDVIRAAGAEGGPSRAQGALPEALGVLPEGVSTVPETQHRDSRQGKSPIQQDGGCPASPSESAHDFQGPNAGGKIPEGLIHSQCATQDVGGNHGVIPETQSQERRDGSRERSKYGGKAVLVGNFKWKDPKNGEDSMIQKGEHCRSKEGSSECEDCGEEDMKASVRNDNTWTQPLQTGHADPVASPRCHGGSGLGPGCCSGSQKTGAHSWATGGGELACPVCPALTCRGSQKHSEWYNTAVHDADQGVVIPETQTQTSGVHEGAAGSKCARAWQPSRQEDRGSMLVLCVPETQTQPLAIQSRPTSPAHSANLHEQGGAGDGSATFIPGSLRQPWPSRCTDRITLQDCSSAASAAGSLQKVCRPQRAARVTLEDCTTSEDEAGELDSLEWHRSSGVEQAEERELPSQACQGSCGVHHTVTELQSMLLQKEALQGARVLHQEDSMHACPHSTKVEEPRSNAANQSIFRDTRQRGYQGGSDVAEKDHSRRHACFDNSASPFLSFEAHLRRSSHHPGLHQELLDMEGPPLATYRAHSNSHQNSLRCSRRRASATQDPLTEAASKQGPLRQTAPEQATPGRQTTGKHKKITAAGAACDKNACKESSSAGVAVLPEEETLAERGGCKERLGVTMAKGIHKAHACDAALSSTQRMDCSALQNEGLERLWQEELRGAPTMEHRVQLKRSLHGTKGTEIPRPLGGSVRMSTHQQPQHVQALRAAESLLIAGDWPGIRRWNTSAASKDDAGAAAVEGPVSIGRVTEGLQRDVSVTARRRPGQVVKLPAEASHADTDTQGTGQTNTHPSCAVLRGEHGQFVSAHEGTKMPRSGAGGLEWTTPPGERASGTRVRREYVHASDLLIRQFASRTKRVMEGSDANAGVGAPECSHRCELSDLAKGHQSAVVCQTPPGQAGAAPSCSPDRSGTACCGRAKWSNSRSTVPKNPRHLFAPAPAADTGEPGADSPGEEAEVDTEAADSSRLDGGPHAMRENGMAQLPGLTSAAGGRSRLRSTVATSATTPRSLPRGVMAAGDGAEEEDAIDEFEEVSTDLSVATTCLLS